jgi:Spy/CpxP family protein refolding chaperone
MLSRIVMVGLLGSVLMFAQRGGGGGGGGRGGGGGMVPPGSFGPVNKLDRITDMLKLSKDQRKDLKQIFDDAQKEAMPVHEQINKARVAVGEAVVAGKQEEVAKAVDAEASLEAQMTVLELKAFSKFATTLEPDQQQRAGALFQMMRGMFSAKNWNSD